MPKLAFAFVVTQFYADNDLLTKNTDTGVMVNELCKRVPPLVVANGVKRGELQETSGFFASALKSMQLALSLTALACAFGTVSPAAAETRTLKIYHVHLNERSEITFKRNGKYLPDGLNKLNRAVRDWRKNQPTKMDPRLFDLIWEVYKKSGGRDYVNVIGGYRSPATNAMLRKRSSGVAEKSQHVLGKAMDFYIPGVSLKKLRYSGLQAQVGGVGYYPTSGSPFVHMDVGNVRHWPRMSRKELMAVFPDGKTIHVPTDGKPLGGYQVALAAYNARKGKGTSAISGTFAAGSDSVSKPKTLLAALFGGGADEEEDTGASEEVAIAAAAPKPKSTAKAVPLEPEPLPGVPSQTIVAALPKREGAEAIEAPRPDAEVGAAQTAPDALAFAVPVPSKKPRFAAVQAQPDQGEIEAAIAAANAAPEPVVAAVPVDPEAEAAAIQAALGQQPEPEEPFIAGTVPLPGKKPNAPEVLLASVAVPTPRPDAVAGATPLDEVANEIAVADPLLNATADVPVPSAAPVAVQPDVQIAAIPSEKPVAAKPDASLRSAMLEDGTVETASVKTTAKGAKPTAQDAKPGLKAIAKAPTPKVGKFALSDMPVTIANQPVAPEYAQALIRKAPKEVLVSGFSNNGPLPANQFTGKAVNFLRVAKFESTN